MDTTDWSVVVSLTGTWTKVKRRRPAVHDDLGRGDGSDAAEKSAGPRFIAPQAGWTIPRRWRRGGRGLPKGPGKYSEGATKKIDSIGSRAML
jgi:hypothetical protein